MNGKRDMNTTLEPHRGTSSADYSASGTSHTQSWSHQFHLITNCSWAHPIMLFDDYERTQFMIGNSDP